MQCPKCGAEMVLRTSSRGKFYGCSRYPRCKGTAPYKYNNVADDIKPATLSDFKPTPQQEAFFDALLSGSGHYGLSAVAGSGKSSTCIQGILRLPETISIAFVAFGRDIAKVNKVKLAMVSNCHVSTSHSLGLDNIKAVYRHTKIDENKVKNILTAWYQDNITETNFKPARIVELQAYIPTIEKMVAFCKNTLAEPNEVNLDSCVNRKGLMIEDKDKAWVYSMVDFALSESDNMIADMIDMDDMIYLCASGKIPCRQFDVLMVDEAQDYNKSQIQFALRSVKPNGRIFFVGDEFQSIYGFRDADVDAMANLKSFLKAQMLPLSVSFRCCRAVVRFVNENMPWINFESSSFAEEGEVCEISSQTFETSVKEGDMVLCRNNAPLLKPAFALIKRGIKAQIKGKDIGNGIAAMVARIASKYECESMGDLEDAMQEYFDAESAKLTARRNAKGVEFLQDQIDCIHAIIDFGDISEINDIYVAINDIFADNVQGVLFSTVHKAKGMEADHVFIINPELIPGKAKNPADLQQELNIAYVAVTRAKKSLAFVGNANTFRTLPAMYDTIANQED